MSDVGDSRERKVRLKESEKHVSVLIYIFPKTNSVESTKNAELENEKDLRRLRFTVINLFYQTLTDSKTRNNTFNSVFHLSFQHMCMKTFQKRKIKPCVLIGKFPW